MRDKKPTMAQGSNTGRQHFKRQRNFNKRIIYGEARNHYRWLRNVWPLKAKKIEIFPISFLVKQTTIDYIVEGRQFSNKIVALT